MMNPKVKDWVLIGILICLFLIALKPAPQLSVNSQPTSQTISTYNGPQVIQLAPDRIALVETNDTSGLYGTILVFDYDHETKKFNYLGSYNYADYFNNPGKYNIPMH